MRALWGAIKSVAKPLISTAKNIFLPGLANLGKSVAKGAVARGSEWLTSTLSGGPQSDDLLGSVKKLSVDVLGDVKG